jgi:dUTP pyrophosphatase
VGVAHSEQFVLIQWLEKNRRNIVGNNHGTQYFRKVHPNAKAPAYALPGDVGADLCAIEEVTLQPNSFGTSAYKVRTGIVIALPPNHAGLLIPRSGLAANFNVTLANGVGLIDPGYRGEITALMVNHGRSSITIKPGDRIAQLIIVPVILPFWVESSELSDTLRGESGLGSTGR